VLHTPQKYLLSFVINILDESESEKKVKEKEVEIDYKDILNTIKHA